MGEGDSGTSRLDIRALRRCDTPPGGASQVVSQALSHRPGSRTSRETAAYRLATAPPWSTREHGVGDGSDPPEIGPRAAGAGVLSYTLPLWGGAPVEIFLCRKAGPDRHGDSAPQRAVADTRERGMEPDAA